MISKRFNHDYTVGDIPNNIGDRYYSQDLSRDMHFLMDAAGHAGFDFLANKSITKCVISGGVITQVSNTAVINITAGIGWVPFSVKASTSPFVVPPPVTSEDIDWMRVKWPAILSLSLSNITLSVRNYIKIKFTWANTDSRLRVKAGGSYYYTQTPSYTVTCDSTAPTAYEICLGEFTAPASFPNTLIITGQYRDYSPLLTTDYAFQKNEYFSVTANSNNPPSVGQYSTFKIYQNGLWRIVYEPLARTFAWSVDLFPALGTSLTYYLYCQSVNTDGTGRYGVSTNSPTWDAIKQGFYSTDGRVICSFYVDGSGNVGSIIYIMDYKEKQVYIVGGTYNNIYLNILGQAGFSLTRGILIPYQTWDGTWLLSGKIGISQTSNVYGAITIAGIKFKNIGGYYQPVSVTPTFALSSVIANYAAPNTANIITYFSSGQASFTISLDDLELDAKPDWVA